MKKNLKSIYKNLVKNQQTILEIFETPEFHTSPRIVTSPEDTPGVFLALLKPTLDTEQPQKTLDFLKLYPSTQQHPYKPHLDSHEQTLASSVRLEYDLRKVPFLPGVKLFQKAKNENRKLAELHNQTNDETFSQLLSYAVRATWQKHSSRMKLSNYEKAMLIAGELPADLKNPDTVLFLKENLTGALFIQKPFKSDHHVYGSFFENGKLERTLGDNFEAEHSYLKLISSHQKINKLLNHTINNHTFNNSKKLNELVDSVFEHRWNETIRIHEELEKLNPAPASRL